MRTLVKKFIGSVRKVDYNYLYNKGVAFKDIVIEGEHRYVNLTKIGTRIPYNEHHILLKGYHFAQSLHQVAGAKFIAEGEEVLVEIGGIKVSVQTEEELFILNEVYVEGVYNLISKPCVVVDIGMNVGFSSLYFASKDYVKAVYSYEPFLETYKQGIRNFSLNPGYSKKINPHNVGLGKQDNTLEVEYCPDWKGAMSIYGIAEDVAEQRAIRLSETQKQSISIVNAGTEIEKIKSAHAHHKLVAKIDCEGAEYEIIEALESSGNLKHFDALMIEWHALGPSALIDTLFANGFTIFSPQPFQQKAGMLYAIK